MTRTARRYPPGAVALLAACLAAVLSGCADGDAAASAPVPPSSSTGAPPDFSQVELVAPAVEPRPPAEVATPTEEGAIAFVRFWFDALNHSLATNDDEVLSGYSGGSCPQCNAWFLLVARHRSESAVQEGGLTAPVSLAIGPFSASEPVPFAATFVTTAARVTYPDGRVEEYARLVSEGTLTVLWSEESSRWIMVDVTLQAG